MVGNDVLNACRMNSLFQNFQFFFMSLILHFLFPLRTLNSRFGIGYFISRNTRIDIRVISTLIVTRSYF